MQAYVINLPHRYERWQRFNSQYVNHDLLSLFGPAVHWMGVDGAQVQSIDPDMTDGQWGCYRSHVNVLEDMLSSGVDEAIIFEDDALLCADFRAKFVDFMHTIRFQYPEWSTILLGAEHKLPPRILMHGELCKPTSISRSHCYMVTRSSAKALYDASVLSPLPFDDILNQHCKDFGESFCPPRWLVGQGGFQSDIRDEVVPIQFCNGDDT